MQKPPTITPLPLAIAPLDILAQWPLDQPVTMLHSGRIDQRWARWSVLGAPTARYQFSLERRSQWIGECPTFLREVQFTHDPLKDVDSIVEATKIESGIAAEICNVPFAGGWIGYFSYDLGRVIEPKAQAARGAKDDRHWPLIDLAWCDRALAFDHVAQKWWGIGDDLVARLSQFTSDETHHDFELGPLKADLDRRTYESMVRTTIEAIAAGDVYQANIAQRFTATMTGSPRGLCCSAFHAARPWYGAYLECSNDRTIISLSPELFLQVEPANRSVITRPIKGTRPGTIDPQRLADSAKDAAELHMIVDLMRNDLGRVCEIGTVRVNQARVIESHPTVHHGVGEVKGVMREAAGVGDLLRATFPGGSITGAPKIRAMQIIDELETVRRGPYCGAIGMISDCGAVQLNIAIRTMLLANRVMDYWAGAGIVADSDPVAEFCETLDKAAVVQSLCSGSGVPTLV